jgi:15-cis-phytoene desaturase
VQKRVIIIGSGLAGMSTAVELLKQGIKPIILEKNDYLGGRTGSWIDDGMPVESGLHRFLGFYKHLPNLLAKVGLILTTLFVGKMK